MRRMLLVPLTAALLLPAGGIAEDPVPLAARSLVFVGQGAGHLVFELPLESLIDDVRVLVPLDDDVFGVRLTGPNNYFYIIDARGHVPPFVGVNTLRPGTYHAYAFGPPDRPFGFEIVLGDLEGEASYAMAPHQGRAFRLGAIGGDLASAGGPAIEIDRAPAVVDARSMVVLAERFALAGAGATAILGGLHVQASALQSDCIPRPGEVAISGGMVEMGAQATFLLEPDAWELGIDYAAPGTLATIYHDSFGIAYPPVPGDNARPTADAYWAIWYGNAGLSSVPTKLQALARSAACTSVSHEAIQALAGNP